MSLDLATFVAAWLRSRRTDVLRDRDALETLQARWRDRHLAWVAEHSCFYRAYAGRALAEWPIVSKSEWMANFDQINTAGARRTELETIAARAESSRDFSPPWQGHTVGFSTGTSGSRGLFFVSPRERAAWAGTISGRMLSPSPWREQRLALVLRAGSPLYERTSTLRIRFRWFDQSQPWDRIVSGLVEYRPTILIAPARVLALLAQDAPRLRPRRVISVAEVLDELDRGRIEAAFGVRVEQVYQATEGLLGTSCEYGTVHLMEPYVLFEPQWLDQARTRFTPLIADLWRRTQPVIRYRMNDVLRVRGSPCTCGRAALALDAIDGRLDDLLWLHGDRGPVCVFPDLLTRELVLGAPGVSDYCITELGRGRWQVAMQPLPLPETCKLLVSRLSALATRLGARPPHLEFITLEARPLVGKQRRVLASRQLSCAS